MKIARSFRRQAYIGLIGAVAISLPLATGTVAFAATTNPNAPTPVQSGLSASALPNASVFGNTPPNTPETVSFVLKIQNKPQLEASVEHGVRNFVSTSQFAHIYGQSPQNIAALRGYLAQFGITTSSYADNIDVVANGTAGQFNSALSVQQKQFHVPRVAGHNGSAAVPAQTVHANLGSPLLPFRLSVFVDAILGLTNYSPFVSQTAHVPDNVTTPQALSTNDCLALTGLSTACNLPSDFASNYGLNPLYQRHATGAGQTLAIVTLAAVDPGAPQYFWANIAHVPASVRTLTVTNIDGGPGAPSNAAGTGETDLDLEQSGALAPNANVIDYQAPNTDSGFADAFFQAASDNTAGTVSTSWSASETIVQAEVAAGEETPAYSSAFDEALLEMAVQGQSTFDASGDEGAYFASADLGTTNLSVGVSPDSPYVTAAGGTTLPLTDTLTGPGGSASVTVPNQRTWGWDYLWQAFATSDGTTLAAAATSHVVGSGGGFSQFEPTPSYQQGVSGTHTFSAVKYLTPTTFQNFSGLSLPTQWSLNPTPSVTHGFGNGRAVPDVSADADPFSGYLLYSPSFATATPAQPVLQGGWGGTSFVAPQLNGAAAVINSLLGHRVGLWNPAMYSLATSHASPFTPLNQSGTGSDNIFYTGTPGTLFNEGSGLGTPNLSAFAFDLGGRH